MNVLFAVIIVKVILGIDPVLITWGSFKKKRRKASGINEKVLEKVVHLWLRHFQIPHKLIIEVQIFISQNVQ